MSTNPKSTTDLDFLKNWQNNSEYFEMLKLMSSLSQLFSENTIPYLDYRLTENLFCKYFNAINDARSCTAYDARIGNLGIGIKTFCISQKGCSSEKVAEFDKLRPQLIGLKGEELAQKLASFRNDRIAFSNATYGITNSIYHIVGRQSERLTIFNTPYREIDINNINPKQIKDTETSISFNDGIDYYTFNKSKSVLSKRFEVNKIHTDLDVKIIKDPFQLLQTLVSDKIKPADIDFNHTKGKNYIILPLYSERGHIKHVPLKSGLNQWNAAGRKRHPDEIYIAVPRVIHQKYPDFFPDNKTSFELELPDGNKLSAKLCQQGDKGLMSNPNSALGNWILRKLLNIAPRQIVTMEDLDRYGIDSIKIEKKNTKNAVGMLQYKINFTSEAYENYADFIE